MYKRQAAKKIQSAKAEIEKNEKTLEEQKQNAQTQIDEANTKKTELTSTLQLVNQSLEQVTQAYNDVVNKLNDSSLSEEEKVTLTAVSYTHLLFQGLNIVIQIKYNLLYLKLINEIQKVVECCL